ncbi:MAG: hypothetical protein M1343_10080 [Chloroflexi bacterium]|nr:hypothetical protein [Chloroflexota bacterium]
MVTGQVVSGASHFGLDGRNLERRLARAVVSLVREHQDAIQRHRAITITVFVDRETGEVRGSFILAGKE